MRPSWNYRRSVRAVVWSIAVWLCICGASQTGWSQEGAGQEDMTPKKKARKAAVPSRQTGAAKVPITNPGAIQLQQPKPGLPARQPGTPTPDRMQPPATGRPAQVQITPPQVTPAQPAVGGFPARPLPGVPPSVTTPTGQPSGGIIFYPGQPASPLTRRETTPLQPRGGVCDLLVEDIQVMPSSVTQGNPILVRAVISNRSGVALANVPVRFCLGETPIGADAFVNIGALSSVLVEKKLPAETAGVSSASVWVDPGNAILEADETNNVRQAGVQISAAALSPGYAQPDRADITKLEPPKLLGSGTGPPNLTCTIPDVKGVYVGDGNSVKVQIMNFGENPSPPFQAGFRPANQSILGKGQYLGLLPVNTSLPNMSFKPGQIRTLTVMLNQPIVTLANWDKLSYVAVVDTADEVAEGTGGEGANNVSNSVTYAIAFPDLVCEVATVNGVYTGDGKFVDVKIKNQGSAPVAIPADLGVALCLASQANQPAVQWVGAATAPVTNQEPLDSGGTRTVKVPWKKFGIEQAAMPSTKTVKYYSPKTIADTKSSPTPEPDNNWYVAVVDSGKQIMEGPATSAPEKNNVSEPFRYTTVVMIPPAVDVPVFVPIKDAVQIKKLMVISGPDVAVDQPITISADVVNEDAWQVNYVYLNSQGQPVLKPNEIVATKTEAFPEWGINVPLPAPWSAKSGPQSDKVRVELTAWNTYNKSKDQKYAEVSLAQLLDGTFTITAVTYTWEGGDVKKTGKIDNVHVQFEAVTNKPFKLGTHGHPDYGSLWLYCGIKNILWASATKDTPGYVYEDLAATGAFSISGMNSQTFSDYLSNALDPHSSGKVSFWVNFNPSCFKKVQGAHYMEKLTSPMPFQPGGLKYFTWYPKMYLTVSAATKSGVKTATQTVPIKGAAMTTQPPGGNLWGPLPYDDCNACSK